MKFKPHPDVSSYAFEGAREDLIALIKEKIANGGYGGALKLIGEDGRVVGYVAPRGDEVALGIDTRHKTFTVEYAGGAADISGEGGGDSGEGGSM